MEYWSRKERRDRRGDQNSMGDLNTLESPRKYVGAMARSSISRETRRKWKKENKKKNNYFDVEIEKYSQDDGGDSFVVSLSTHAH